MAVNNPPTSSLDSDTGTYTGDDTANRAIPHNLGRKPKVVLIYGFSYFGYMLYEDDGIIHYCGSTNGAKSVTTMTDTNFYVGNVANYSETCNKDTRDYYWTAIG